MRDAIDKKTDQVVHVATQILQQMNDKNMETRFCLAVLGNAFTRLAAAMGHTAQSFKELASDMADAMEKP